MASKDLLWFDFTFVPPVGLRVRYRKKFVTLVGSAPYTRKDGTASTVLVWRDDNGALFTSGMRANAMGRFNPASDEVKA